MLVLFKLLHPRTNLISLKIFSDKTLHITDTSCKYEEAFQDMESLRTQRVFHLAEQHDFHRGP